MYLCVCLNALFDSMCFCDCLFIIRNCVVFLKVVAVNPLLHFNFTFRCFSFRFIHAEVSLLVFKNWNRAVIVDYYKISHVFLLTQRFKPLNNFNSPFFKLYKSCTTKLGYLTIIHQQGVEYVYTASAATHNALKLSWFVW